jgi:hypothetical protein
MAWATFVHDLHGAAGRQCALSCPLRDLFLQLALTEIFKANGTASGSTPSYATNRTVKGQLLERTRGLMDSHVRDFPVTGYEALIPVIQLPDPDDRHVAAAIVGRRDVIVTQNLKHFDAVLAPYGISVQHPDEFPR